MKPLVIYHSPCTDGWTAAWAVAKAHGGPEHVELKPANYGEVLAGGTIQLRELLEGRDVVIVDFSYDREALEEMREMADSLLVLDHHKTAQEELEGLDYAHFDMKRSGAAMAWDYFHPGTQRPQLVEYVQDRDLWTKALPHTEEVSAAIGLVEHTYEAWEELHAHMEGPDIRGVMLEGATVLRHRQQLIKYSVARAGLLSLMGRSEIVPGVVCEPTLRSEVGHQLLASGQFPYSVTFRESADGFTYSLRSGDHLADVAEIARALKNQFGCVRSGGGHRNAAGVHATVPIHTWVAADKG